MWSLKLDSFTQSLMIYPCRRNAHYECRYSWHRPIHVVVLWNHSARQPAGGEPRGWLSYLPHHRHVDCGQHICRPAWSRFHWCSGYNYYHWFIVVVSSLPLVIIAVLVSIVETALHRFWIVHRSIFKGPVGLAVSLMILNNSNHSP